MNFVCPRCQVSLIQIAQDQLRCGNDALTFFQVDGIWRFLLPERESHYQRFIADYETVRRSEGRFSTNDSFYRALPFKDLSGRFAADWKIRAASYRALLKLFGAKSNVLDLGAGNGWLSNRLSALGHRVCAVDLLVNSEDGLGAWKYYETEFTAIQAEFVHLPIPNAAMEAVVFNASFHYSENYETTLAESLRTLQPNGWVIIMDSPVYRDAASGEQMVAERKAAFISRFGFASDSIKSENYLTLQRIDELGAMLGIRWQRIRPYYGLRWAVRPLWAGMRGRREPADFGLWVGTRG